MNISRLQNFQNISLKSNFVNNPNKLERTPNKDMVSFSGLKAVSDKTNNPVIDNAIDLGTTLIAFPRQLSSNANVISNILRNNNCTLAVKPNSSDVNSAVFVTELTPEFTTKNNTIIINTTNHEIKDDNERLAFIRKVVHSYVNFEQSKTNEAANILKLLSKGNYEEAKDIKNIGNVIFQIFSGHFQDTATSKDIPFINDKQSCEIREKEISEKNVFRGLDLADAKEFNKYIMDNYNVLFKSVIQKFPNTAKYASDEKKLALFSSKVLSYMAIKAKNEEEAYQAECELAKKNLKTKENLNIEIFPLYYQMLGKVFREG